MKHFAALIAIAVFVVSVAPGEILAQSPGTGQSAPVTGLKPDRTTADPATRRAMGERRAAVRQKRADCRKQARQQKVALLKRRAFIRDCAARS